jgi:hypothetical protein
MTDVIATGTVGAGRSYLSDDETEIYTDYPLSDAIVLYPPSFFERSTRPGQPTPTFAVTLLGGTIVFNGVSFTEKEPALLPLRPGIRGLFLLRRKDMKRATKYVSSGSLPFYGAFDISDGLLTPLHGREDFAQEYRGKPASDVIATIPHLRQGR